MLLYVHHDYYQHFIVYKVKSFVNCNEVVFNLMSFECFAFFAAFLLSCYYVVLLYHCIICISGDYILVYILTDVVCDSGQ